MAFNFKGNAEELKAFVASKGVSGQWSSDETGKQIFRADDNGILNFWPGKGTIQCQGKPEAKARLESMFSDGIAEQPAARPAAAKKLEKGTKIFVVHGHDTAALEQLELVLRRLGLDPYILQNNDGQSRTLIEALEQQIYKDAAFGIVLMTPDDYGYAKTKGEADRQPRARQNVILELGMVLASLGRQRMVLLKKGALELPTDVNGVIYLEFNDHVKEVAVKLATRMKGAGIEIDDSLIAGSGA